MGSENETKAPALVKEDATTEVSSKSSDDEKPTHSKGRASQRTSGQGLLMPAPVRHRRMAVQYDSSSDEEEVDASKLRLDAEDDVVLVAKEVKKREWKCGFCPEIFSDRASMASHCKVHDGKRNYTCPCCDKKFRRPEACNLHYNEHFVMKCFACRSCHRRFARLGNLWNHKLMHQELMKRAQRKQPNWICDKCSQTFVIRSELVEHCLKVGPCYDAKFAQPVAGTSKKTFQELFAFAGPVTDSPAGLDFEIEPISKDDEPLDSNGVLDANPILRAALGGPREPQRDDGAYSLALLD